MPDPGRAPTRRVVRLAVVGALLLAACSSGAGSVPATPVGPGAPTTTAAGTAGQAAGKLPAGIVVQRHLFAAREGSGVVASAKDPDLLWAIRDNGPSTPGKPRAALYGYRVAGGRLAEAAPGMKFAIVPVPGVADNDWEDIARDGQGNLWIADIGDNDCQRASAALLKVSEPDPAADRSARLLATYRFTYPDPKPGCKGWNAESLVLVDGVPYVISKAPKPAVYRLPRLDPRAVVTAERIGALAPAPGIDSSHLTGADLSGDRQRLAVVNYGGLLIYQASRPGLRGDALVADLIGRAPRWVIRFGCMSCPTASQVEGVAFRPGGHDLALLSESRDLWSVPAASYERPP